MTNDALDILFELRAVGMALTRDGDTLRVRPSSKLTEPRRQAISVHKRELLAALDAERVASQIIDRAARRGIGSPSPPRQAAIPGQPPNRCGLLPQIPRGPEGRVQ
jgi:hypothetical protein